MTAPAIHPRDEFNERLLANVHPPDWRNPEPADRYNLVVVGAGSGGLVSAAVAAGLGARVALVERGLMGGDCLNVGCVPSKALIRAARMVAEARRAAEELGLPAVDPERVDFGAAMRRVRAVRARISPVDSARRFRDELGVDVFLGEARFTARDAVEVGGRRLAFRKAIVATGGRPAAPPIPGLAEAGYRTNENLFELTERPARLAIIGAGPIGCEMAQAFQRLGTQVSLVDQAAQVLVREDEDAAAVVQRRLRAEGVELLLESQVVGVEARGAEKVLRVRSGDAAEREIAVDELLVAVGRAPNVEGLGLEAAGVDFDPRHGVKVDDHLRTTNGDVFATGDVCMRWKFTHAADAGAKIAVQNALFLPTAKQSSLVMPWCTYTDPEVAHVGLSERDADVDTWTVPLAEVDRAVTDGEDEGFAKIHTKKGGDAIVGATVVSAHAGEMISEITLAIVGKLGLKTLMQAIHPYPTQAEALKRAAGAYTRTRATPLVKKVLSGYMSLRR